MREGVFQRLPPGGFERHLSVIHGVMIDGIVHTTVDAENLPPGLSISGQRDE
jgi:hypothetical protein